MDNQCKFCGRETETREDGCWECANAESIIAEGLDMYDKGLGSDRRETFAGNKGTPATTPGDKLRLLIEKGWTQQPKK